jgi:NTE family protein
MEVAAEIHTVDAKDFEDDSDLFNRLEQHEGINILACSADHKEWSEKCILYADLVIVSTDFYTSPDLHPLEIELELYAQNILNKRTYLLLLHPEEGPMPKHTKVWLKQRKVDMHLHLRKNNEYDARRLCRILSHKAVGLVLGGGGAKGFAHIGAAQAIYEAGLEIDFLGGSSAGALYGLGMSFADFKFDRIHALNEEAVKRRLTKNDLTIPLISMMSGKKFKKYLVQMFQNHDIEDLWINSYAVSTNFSKAKADVHRIGPLWRKVLASMAIPGIFPPVVIDKSLHVDGGVMDNLPIESMYYYPVDNIIAISLSTLKVIDVDYKETPAGWHLAWNKLLRKKAFKIPGLSSIIINSLIINSQQKQEITKEQVSHYIELDLKGIGMLDDKRWKKLCSEGMNRRRNILVG